MMHCSSSKHLRTAVCKFRIFLGSGLMHLQFQIHSSWISVKVCHVFFAKSCRIINLWEFVPFSSRSRNTKSRKSNLTSRSFSTGRFYSSVFYPILPKHPVGHQVNWPCPWLWVWLLTLYSILVKVNDGMHSPSGNIEAKGITGTHCCERLYDAFSHSYKPISLILVLLLAVNYGEYDRETTGKVSLIGRVRFV